MKFLKSRLVMGASRETNQTTKVGACQNPAPGSAGPAEKYSAITVYSTFCVFGNLRNPMKLLERLSGFRTRLLNVSFLEWLGLRSGAYQHKVAPGSHWALASTRAHLVTFVSRLEFSDGPKCRPSFFYFLRSPKLRVSHSTFEN